MSLWREVSIFAFFRDVVVCAAIAIGLGFPSTVMRLDATPQDHAQTHHDFPATVPSLNQNRRCARVVWPCIAR